VFLVLAAGAAVFLFVIGYMVMELTDLFTMKYTAHLSDTVASVVGEIKKNPFPPLDKALYDLKMEALANNPLQEPSSTSTPPRDNLWPAKAPYPKDGALLPFNRIIAYYGNFYSTRMGVLGEYPEDTMLSMLKAEKTKWEAADPSTPVIPAIHYIVATAQGSPGEDGMYRLRMPESEIDKAIAIAKKVDGIVFLDIQIGLSSLQAEIPRLEKYLKLPHVHLGLDPEFSMKTGAKPGTVIGTMDAADINYASNYLAKLVNENGLPPKILVVHRFTRPMVTNYQNIIKIPEVQIVMNMDGWGPPANKITTYTSFIAPEPVQFTGFKIFYKNDLKSPSTGLLTPQQLLELRPRPIYIQYQ
jgi:hypothetical protein